MRSSMVKPDVFFTKMKKKPALQAILDNLDSYSEADLNSLPNQPLWIREELVKLKQRNGLNSAQSAEALANAMEAASPTPAPEVPREVREWRADQEFIGRSGFEIMPGDLFVVLPPYTEKSLYSGLEFSKTVMEIKVDSTVIQIDPKDWMSILQRSQLVGTMGAKEYRIAVQNRLDKKNNY